MWKLLGLMFGDDLLFCDKLKEDLRSVVEHFAGV